MKLLQTYYTSCQIGQTGSSGFQFYSYSEGIKEAELDEIGKLGSYTAPYGSNPFPTEDEVINVLPVAFKYFRLSSGRVGVLQSTACTQEYTGRPGNYFTHALLLEEGEFPFWPVMMHKGDCFRHDLTNEQKNIQSVPPLLPALVIDGSAFAAVPDQNDFFIRQFIGQGNNRELLSKLLDIILSGEDKQKRIIIADHTPEEVIYALSIALPSKNVPDLTFSTYSLHPEAQNVLLSASRYEGSDFNFDDASMRFSYYVFNHVNGKYAELEDQSEFSKILVGLLASEPQRIKELYAYSDHFTGAKDIKSIDLIASIFSGPDMMSKWEQIIPFVTDNAKPEYVETFLSIHKEQIVKLTDTLQNDDDICRFLEDLLQLIHKLPDTSAWLDTFFNMYLSIIVDRLDSPTKSLIEFNKQILAIFKGNDREFFTRKIVLHDTFPHLCRQAQTYPAQMNVFAFIISSCKTLTGSIKGFDGLLQKHDITDVIKDIDEERITPETFQVLISEIPGEMDVLLPGISGINAGLTKRFICELSDEQTAVSLNKVILKGTFNNPTINGDIRKEVIDLLEKKALTQIPGEEELNIYQQFRKDIDAGYPAIGLILDRKGNPVTIIEQMGALRDAKKIAVFLDWKGTEIFPGLKQPEAWKKFYSLSKYVSVDSLNDFVKKYFGQAKDTAPMVALITHAHADNDRQIEDTLRLILASMQGSVYNTLKQQMEENHDDIYEYFISLNRGMKLKRLFKFKF